MSRTETRHGRNANDPTEQRERYPLVVKALTPRWRALLEKMPPEAQLLMDLLVEVNVRIARERAAEALNARDAGDIGDGGGMTVWRNS